MYNHTQTIESIRSQARVLGYYYRPSLSIGRGSLSHVQTRYREQLVDTLVPQVYAFIMRQHMRRYEQCGILQCRVFWEEQANGLVPYLRAQPTRLSFCSSTDLFYHKGGRVETQPPIPNKERCSHPNPLEGDGTSRAGWLMRIFMHHESKSKVLK
jgi:hypothetical protein